VYQRVVSVQAAVVLLAVGAAAWLAGADAAIATAYGGALAIVNTGLLGRRVELAGELAKQNPTQGAYALYAGAVQRFVLVLVGLGLGMGWLELQPLAVLAGLVLGQGAHMAATAREALRPTPRKRGPG
jgi:ATP synthase protein I